MFLVFCLGEPGTNQAGVLDEGRAPFSMGLSKLSL